MAAPNIDIELVKVKNAVSAALQLVGVVGVKEKSLFPDEEMLNLAVTLKQMPSVKYGDWKGISVTLPHSPYQNTISVCLFVKDIDKKSNVIDNEITIRHYRELLENCGITCISEIIPMHMLQTEFKPFEAKRKLALSYDFFLADARIYGYLPALLGKEFKKRKRLPLKVNVRKLSIDVPKSLRKSTLLISSTSAAGQLVIGHCDQQKNVLVKNIFAACKQLDSVIPGGWANVNTLHVKNRSTLSVPIYIATDFSVYTSGEKRKKNDSKIEPEEVSTVLKGKVIVYPRGKTKVVRDETQDDDDSDDENEVEPDKKQRKKSDAQNNSESEKSETEDELEHIEDKHVAKRLRVENLKPTDVIGVKMQLTDKRTEKEKWKKGDRKQKYDKKTARFNKKKQEKPNTRARKNASISKASSRTVNKKKLLSKSSETKNRSNVKGNHKQCSTINGFKRK